MAGLIEFAVIGDKGFHGDTQDFSAFHDSRTVVEIVVIKHGKAGNGQNIVVF
ncbi:hypothetical protein SDC9_96975 [bioreactor metagenome]|uniref:Uncharacterized protein n=1 Tax=bioreactor metagenome TaxID=1076179 RepID=A0A645AAJ2_9ZZZZ